MSDLQQKNKIGVIGRRGDVLTYQAAGFAVYQAETVAVAEEMLHRAADECAIVFLTPAYAAALREDVQKYDTQLTPAVIALPERGGGIGMQLLRQAAERAIGADILFRE